MWAFRMLNYYNQSVNQYFKALLKCLTSHLSKLLLNLTAKSRKEVELSYVYVYRHKKQKNKNAIKQFKHKHTTTQSLNKKNATVRPLCRERTPPASNTVTSSCWTNSRWLETTTGWKCKKPIKYCDTKNNSNWNVFDLLTCLEEISLLLAVSF